MKRVIPLLTGLLLLGAGASTSLAVPVTYDLSGALTGDFNGTPFANAGFQLQVTADTDNVKGVSLFAVNDIYAVGNYTPLFNGPDLSGSLAITGLGSLTFADRLWVWATQGTSLNPGFLGIGTDSEADFLDVQDFYFETYHLVSAVNALPVAAWQPSGVSFAVFDALGVPGVISISGASGVTFAATGGVPEPSTVILFGAGLAGLLALRRKRA